MIDVGFFQTPSGELLGFHILGHSGQGEAGEDILCAAVSSAAYLVANTVSEILKINAALMTHDGEMLVRVDQKDAAACRVLFAGLKLHLIGLEEQYPQNIKVSYTEV